ncbi:MAG TPA: VTT domain-containing protein [Candidatus Saccharimonadales bacterium]|nr:VTT domain-containing protein [Candidatus Saccharimonadales bacterium]
MLFGLNLEDVIATVGLFGVAGIIFAESGLLIGFFLPGDTLLFTVGLLTHEGVISTSVHLVILVLFIAAVLGDNVGYMFGKRVGPRIFRKPDSILFHQDNLDRAEKFYEKYGPMTIVIARFVPIVRTFAPIVAGVGKMPYRKFLAFNLVGGLLWTAGITYVGYFGGAFLEARGIEIDHLILPIIGIAMAITLFSPIYHIVREPSARKIVKNKLRKLFKTKHEPAAKQD